MADFDWVTNRVATGAALADHTNVDQIVAAGINVVVDARDDFNDGALLAGAAGIHYLWNPTPDDGLPKPVPYWQRTLSFVLPLLAQPGFKVLLHCRCGINRGPSNALAVLVAQGLHRDYAINLIIAARPQARINYAGDAVVACDELGYT